MEPITYAIRQELLSSQRVINTIYDLFEEVDMSTLSNRKKRYWCIFYCSDVATQTDMSIVMQFTRNASAINAENTAKFKKQLMAWLVSPRLQTRNSRL